MAAVQTVATGRLQAQGRRYARLVWLELRFSYAWLLMPLAVAAAIWFFNGWMWQPNRRWDVISSNVAQSFLLIGPAGAMWTAYVAAREGRSRLADLTASLPVRSLPRHLLVIGTPVAGSVLAYALGALAIVGWYGRAITWGGPDWWLIGFGGLVVLACAMVGAAAGRVVQGRFAPVIVSGSIFLYFVMSLSIAGHGTTSRGWALLAYPRDQLDLTSPLMAYPSTIDTDEAPLIAGAMICGAVIAAALAVLVASHRRWLVATPFAALAVLGFAVAVPLTTITAEDRATAMAVLQDGPRPVENPPLVCAGEIVTTCLHQVDEVDLQEASATVDALLSPVMGLPGVPERIEMRADVPSEPGILRSNLAGYEIDAAQLSDAVMLDVFDPDGRGEALTPAEQVIAAWLILPILPLDDIWFIAPTELPNGDEDLEALRAWRAEITTEAERFAALSPEERQSWLEANWDDLRAGELTLEDLP